MPLKVWNRLDREDGAKRQSACQALCLFGLVVPCGTTETKPRKEYSEMSDEQYTQRRPNGQDESQGPETVAWLKAIKFGLTGSVAGTMAMDLVIVVEFLIAGEPVDGFLALIGSVMGGGTLVGVVTHLLVGLLLGLLFATAVCNVRFLNIESVWKGVWLGVLAGLATIPLGCIPFAILANVPIIEMVSFSFIPHLMWGTVLGVIAGHAMRSGLRSAKVPARNPAGSTL